MKYDISEYLDELSRCYKICNDPDSAVNLEIQMWRQRFIKQYLNKNIEKQDLGHAYFMSAPSEEFMKLSPENHVIKLDLL